MSGRRPPGPAGHPIWGNLPAVRSDVLGLVTGATRDYGEVVQFGTGLWPWPVVMVNEPELARQVLQERHKIYTKETRSTARIALGAGESLLTSSGEWWRTQRRRMQPVFQRSGVAGLEGTMREAIEECVVRWNVLADRGEPVDVASEMMRLAFTIAARCLFGADLGAMADRVEAALAIVLRHIWAGLRQFVNLPSWVPTPTNIRFQKALNELDRVVYGIIRRRRAKKPSESRDLLSVLLNATDGETDDRMTDRQLRNEVITLLVAGHETTANALSWTWHLLAHHPSQWNRLEEQLRSAEGREPPAFVEQVLLESMRLYPPVWIVERLATDRDLLGEFEIPKGSSVLVCPYVMHRHPAHWEDADRFRPERFSDGKPPVESQRSYLPFGLGPRQCIGHHFALMEAKLVIATLTRHFHLEPIQDHPVIPDPGITLRLKHGLQMRIRRRR